MSEQEHEEPPERLFFAEAVGMLVSLLDEGALDRRRVAYRLRKVQHSGDFESLPEDLRARVQEIIADAER